MAEGFEKKEGLPLMGQAGAMDDIIKLGNFVAKSDNATFTAEIAKTVNMQDHYNWIIYATAIEAMDTLGKNALHYHDPMKPAEPWRLSLWDFNEAFGQNWRAQPKPNLTLTDPAEIIYVATGGQGYTNRNWLWRRLWNHATFGPEVRARYGKLIRNEIKLDVVLASFEQMVKETADGARRDERKWGAMFRAYYTRPPTATYDAEVTYVRQWIKDRWGFLATKYP
jgi:hypothetical protein